MSFAFDPAASSIIVPVTLVGPVRTLQAELVLNTGAVQSLVAESLLAAIGCDVAGTPASKTMVTASGRESVPEIPVDEVSALEHTFRDFPVVCYTLPEDTGVDGLLGLDFLRGHELNINFRTGEVTLS